METLFGWGFFWLGLGLALEAFEGGIKKDYATFSYFFVTSGLASFVLIAAGIAMRRLNVRFSALVKCGQNPMVAYTAAGFLIMPLLTLLHLGIRNIRLGPTLPAFLSPNVLNYLVDNFGIAPITTPEADLKQLLK